MTLKCTRRGLVSVAWRPHGQAALVDCAHVERLVTTGGREHELHPSHPTTTITRAHLSALVDRHGLRRVAHGAARLGSDKIVDTVASQLVVAGRLGEVATYPVSDEEWRENGRAGLERNICMLEAERPPLVLAYPDPRSRGTWHCTVAALERDITVSVRVPWPKPPGGRAGVVAALIGGLTLYARTPLDLIAECTGQQITVCPAHVDHTLMRSVAATLQVAEMECV